MMGRPCPPENALAMPQFDGVAPRRQRCPMKLTWRDADEVAWALMDKYPDQDPLRLSFPKLHKMVVELEGFSDDPNASNERILENIQMAWYEEVK